MNSEISRIHICLASSSRDRARALQFITQSAWESHHCEPPPHSPEIILVAYSNSNEVVGTMSLDFADRHNSFPLETHWEFDHLQTPLPFCRTRIVQFGRWMSTSPGVAVPLVHAAAQWSLEQSKTAILFEAKKSAATRLVRLGIPVLPIASASLVAGNLPPVSRRYYETPPIPQLFMVSTKEVVEACLQKYPSLQASNLRKD